jgi:hypothetical protein
LQQTTQAGRQALGERALKRESQALAGADQVIPQYRHNYLTERDVAAGCAGVEGLEEEGQRAAADRDLYLYRGKGLAALKAELEITAEDQVKG